MGRRLISSIALAMLVALGVRLAPAHGEDPLPAPADPAAQAPAEVPPPAEMLPPVPGPVPPPTATAAAGETRPAPSNANAIAKPKSAAKAKAAPGLSNSLEPPGPSLPADAGPGASLPGALEPSPGVPLGPADPMAVSTGNPAGAAPERDPDVERSQNRPLGSSRSPGPASETNPLPPALQDGPGRPGAPTASPEPDHFVIQPERLGAGKQSIGLSVEVKGPPTVNLNKEATYRIIVSNSGSTDATDVDVRDVLPPGMELISSQPQEQRGPDSLLYWRLSTVSAGSEQVITLRVRPTQVGQYDHAATVTARAGAKSRTRVYKPELKIEQTASAAEKILKNRPVEFKIAVTNTGDGPVRDVVVLAKLSPGLKGDAGDPSSENLYELELKNDLPNGVLLPNQRIELEPLVADTIQGGEQYCKVRAISPDVQPGAPEAENTRTILVIEPKLKLSVIYPSQRFTETLASYAVIVENPGTAPARNVQVVASLDLGGRLVGELSGGARFDTASRRIRWPAFQLDPGEKQKVTLPFQVHVAGPGIFKVSAEARAEGALAERFVAKTTVEGLADLDLEISEGRRVVDVNDETVFTIKVKNIGTKEASQILISARHSDNVKVVMTAGTDKEAKYGDKPGEFFFPQIDRLAKDQTLTLRVRVKAVKEGLATCRVFVRHDQDADQPIEDIANFRITPARR